MGDWGDLKAASNKEAEDNAGLGTKPADSPHAHNGDKQNSHDGQTGLPTEKENVSPLKWLAETFSLQGKAGNENKAETAIKQKVLDVLPLMLDAVVLQAPKEKSYSLIVDLEGEVARKLNHAPDKAREFYIEMRQDQMAHKPIGLDAMQHMNAADAAGYRDKWAEMNGWLAFPEEDKDCAEGRALTQGYLKRVLDRNGNNAANAEEAKDEVKKNNAQLAKIYSLYLNDHDYLHNEDELTRRNGMHHLPEKFTGIGSDGKEKEFNLKALAERHMLVLLQNAYKSPLKPDERANLTFYSQVLRQVLPQELLDDANKAARDNILKQYVSLYSARDMDLSKAGQGIWQDGRNIAVARYPNMSKVMPGLQLTDAENLYDFFTTTDVRQLFIEGHEMRTLAGKLGKPSELAYPDQERLYEFEKIKGPMREYREGQGQTGIRYMSTVFNAKVKPFVQLNPQEQLRLKNWEATPKDWQLVYWQDNPNTLESKIQSEAHRRFPRSLQCGWSNEGADLLRKWMGPEGLFGDEGDRLSELSQSLRNGGTKQTCVHDSEPRKKGKIN
jgi:hypothetical protein